MLSFLRGPVRPKAAPLSGARPVCSIPVRQHQGDGGLRVVDIDVAALGDELVQFWGAIAVAAVEGERHASAVCG